MYSFSGLLHLHAAVEVNILFREEFNRHVVHRLNLLLEDYRTEQCINAGESGMILTLP